MSAIDSLLCAASDGDIQTVEKILSADPTLANAPGPHPYWGGFPYPLHCAAEWGRTDVVKLLLEKGADVNPPSDRYDGWTPLLCAIGKRRAEVAEMLLRAGARVDIFAACALGDVAAVTRMAPEHVNDIGPN